jgi:transcriptional regulator with XRE-family HTH domain
MKSTALPSLKGDRLVVRTLLERLRSQRLRRNWTQAELAHRAGLSVQSYQNFETGYGNITLANLLRILNILGFGDRLALLVPEPEEERTLRDVSRPPRQRARAKTKRT